MTVVFDTNILVSALVFPGSRAEEAVRRVIDATDELLMSKPILGELLTVLARKFGRDPEELSKVALWLSDLAVWVEPRRRVNVACDEPDNRILECALAGGASQVVTGDKGLLRLASFEGIPIVTLREYLKAEI